MMSVQCSLINIILTVFLLILNNIFHDVTLYITVIRYLPGGTSIARTARVRIQTCGHRLIFTGLCPLAGDRSHVLYSYLLLKLFIAAPQCCRVCHWWSTQILTALLFSHLAFISSFIWNYKYLAHHKTLYTMEIQEYCIFMWLHYGNVRCEDLVSTLQYASSRSYWHHTSLVCILLWFVSHLHLIPSGYVLLNLIGQERSTFLNSFSRIHKHLMVAWKPKTSQIPVSGLSLKEETRRRIVDSMYLDICVGWDRLRVLTVSARWPAGPDWGWVEMRWSLCWEDGRRSGCEMVRWWGAQRPPVTSGARSRRCHLVIFRY